MTIETTQSRALALHRSGFHCAEAVCSAILEAYGPDLPQDLARAATAFGGGIGRSSEDLCGALAGGLAAIGFLFGRTRPGTDWSQAALLAADFRSGFLAREGATLCPRLLERFGPQENMAACKDLSGRTAGLLAELMENMG